MQERYDLTLFTVNDCGEITWPREKYPDFERVASHLQAKCNASKIAKVQKDIKNQKLFLLPETSFQFNNKLEAFMYICFSNWFSVLWQYVSIVVIDGRQIIFDSHYYSAQELVNKIPLEHLVTPNVQLTSEIIGNRLLLHSDNLNWMEEILRLFMFLRPQYIKFVTYENINSCSLHEKEQLINKLFANS